MACPKQFCELEDLLSREKTKKKTSWEHDGLEHGNESTELKLLSLKTGGVVQ